MAELVPGKLLNEGKTKKIFELPNNRVLVQSKDRITAHNAQKVNDLQGKAAISTKTTCLLFEYLAKLGLPSHFIKQETDTAFVAVRCDMILIEWVTRRVATGSFLKRNPGVQEGYRFSPPKLEFFYKDDAAGDPQWSREQIIEAKMNCGGRVISADDVDKMSRITVAVFEVLEKAWSSLDCSLIDMKIEFGVSAETGEIILADIIDSDSWRLWPSGDRRLMKDKQVYRDLKEVTEESLQVVKKNFEWIMEKVKLFNTKPPAQVVVLMGSPSDAEHCDKIKKSCEELGILCETRVTSAHKGTEETMQILAQYEGCSIPIIFIAVAGRSNGLGPVLSGNTPFPVINCPPIKADWGAQDIWSSLRMPSGMGCSTVLSTEAAALCAAEMLALSDHTIWGTLRVKQLNTWLKLKEADCKMRKAQQEKSA
ncbi:multifunctional protein ADE2-like [Anneissia japonica]|uniref:multifunctional protein ADE2-like n=1 Tax=Anneissia japonica TaxID=1529436 RepID=UPI0014258E66|nr:multifunctional protein ADE2-like [Anneissia japonica]